MMAAAVSENKEQDQKRQLRQMTVLGSPVGEGLHKLAMAQLSAELPIVTTIGTDRALTTAACAEN